MNLRSMSDQQLLSQTENLAREEREILTQILHHLREIENRRLFASLKYKSLFDYAVKQLKYSADQAARRISAMRLLRDLPEIENKIEEGSLSLTNLSLAQNLFRKEGFSKSEKMEVVSQLENRSTREAEKMILSRAASPTVITPDRVRTVSDKFVEIKFVADESLKEKLDRLRGLMAHKQSGLAMADIIQAACDMAIEQLTPKPAALLGAPRRRCDTRSKHISVSARREVWGRAKNRCQNCGSVHALQVDHIKPKAMGGSNEPHNLRLLCRSCNQRAAIEKLGFAKMNLFFGRAE